MNPLKELKNIGQSIWYDNIRKDLMASGELERMVREWGLSGITSNPTIFEKAVSGSQLYDAEILELASRGKRAPGILSSITVNDIIKASEVLLPVFKETNGMDGFVSIEARPSLARDFQGTLDEVRHLFKTINRPNIMVKVPGTDEGVIALEELVYEGFNINVTLLFSVKRYGEIANAYVSGLERRAKDGKPIDGITGVASFFVSRVDTIYDRLIEERIERTPSNDGKMRLKQCLGKAALANARLAYVQFNEVFGGKRFLDLKARGANTQRLLWASTGTKNPMYSDVKYVEGLIGKDTVSTMPLQTMAAFLDHGKASPALAEGLDKAAETMDGLSELGIDYDEVMDKLEEEGIKAFSDSYDALLKCIDDKIASAREKTLPSFELGLNGLEKPVEKSIKEMGSERITERLWEKDPTVWKKDPDHKKLIKNALGWLTLPQVMEDSVDEINGFAKEVKEAGYAHIVLLGMGGSSLAPIVLNEAFGVKKGFPGLIVLDSTDPEAIRAVESAIDPIKTLFIFSSKSGSTIEPLSFFEYFYDRLKATLGEDEAGRNFAAITDPGTALEGFSRKYKFRRLFLNPSDIGGRFSALSFFGLVPAALIGIDIKKLLYFAGRLSEVTLPYVESARNPALTLGAALGVFHQQGKDKLTFFTSQEIRSFGLWIEQLIAESTGKEGKGLIPITGEPKAGPEKYGKDRVFIEISAGGADKELEGFFNGLEKAGHPVVRIRLSDIHEIGAEFFRWEAATAIAGHIIGINPFDQPDVELTKKLALERLARIERKESVTAPGIQLNGRDFSFHFGNSAFAKVSARHKPDDMEKAFGDFLRLVKKGDFLGVLAYYNPFDGLIEMELAEIRKALIKGTGAATQFGFGPRYLHSTGQLHKGGSGPEKGVFIILSHSAKEDVRRPGSPYTFSELELSQAYGDMEALDSKGCRVAMFCAPDPSARALNDILAFIRKTAEKTIS